VEQLERIGPYKILRKINTEGSSKLYEAMHEQIQRRAAIKILHRELADDREALRRFLNQARVVNLIDHPSIVSIYEHGQLENGAPYIVMEWLHGETLRERIRRAGASMDATRAMRIARHIASALAAAHAKQVVHRDLKPGSIMLIPDADTPDGERVKVLNFGIAKLATTTVNSSVVTQAGVSMGTPTYMSPEQCRNAREVTERSDVYVLGILMYEMLSGAPPFSDAEGAVRVMMAQMNQDPPPLQNRAPEASAEVCQLVHRMLAKLPDQRPTAAEVVAILGRHLGLTGSIRMPMFAQPEPPRAPEPSPTRILPPPPPSDEDPSMLTQIMRQPKGRALVVAAAALILLGIIGIILAIGGANRGPPPPPPHVTWTVVSEPTDAEILDEAGQPLGRTPWKKEEPRGKSLVTLTVRKKDYAEEKIVLDRGRDVQRDVTLTKLPPEPKSQIEPPAPPPSETPSKPSKPSKSDGKKKSKTKSKSKKKSR
jgi:serine/threonine protein kinase